MTCVVMDTKKREVYYVTRVSWCDSIQTKTSDPLCHDYNAVPGSQGRKTTCPNCVYVQAHDYTLMTTPS